MRKEAQRKKEELQRKGRDLCRATWEPYTPEELAARAAKTEGTKASVNVARPPSRTEEHGT